MVYIFAIFCIMLEVIKRVCVILFVSASTALIFYPLQGQAQDVPKTKLQRTKVAPALRSLYDISTVQVLVNDTSNFNTWITTVLPSHSVKKIGKNLYTLSDIDSALFKALEKNQNVLFVDRANRKAVEESILGDFDFTVNTIRSVQSVYPEINADGLAVSIKEKPFDQLDLDLRGRVIVTNQFDEQPSFHATFMATIAAGAGNTTPYAKGAAWRAHVTTSDFEQLLPDDGQALTNLGVSVQNHSYGVNDIENYYGIESQAYDQSCNNFPKLLHVFSSGNRGNGTITTGTYANIPGVANLTGQFKVSKNTLSVGSSDRYGNIVPFSSRGPAHDGRVKPELIALGDAGSSDAAAIVSGISLMLQHAYQNIYEELPDAALLKAVLINSAIDTGRPHVDYETGFGNANALNAIRTIEQGTFFSGNIDHQEEQTFNITVPVDINQLKITLAWNDPAAVPGVEKILINDIDLKLRHVQSSNEWSPWVLNTSPSLSALQEDATRGNDRLNNVEQITVALPQAGNYEIIIKGYDIPVGVQKFFVAYDFLSGAEWTYPLQGDALKANTSEIIRWSWNKPDAIGSLEYKFASEDNWRLIDVNVNLQQSWYEWITPDTSALIQFRLIVDSEIVESVSIPVSTPQRIGIGFVCDDEVMLQWNKVANAQNYTVYVLGDKYLESQVVTADTFAIFQKTQLQTNYVSVSPSFAPELSGLRETTIDFNLQGVGCYFKSFLPQSFFVTAAAVFNVQLGTIYNLESATLERFRNNTFESVTSITQPDLQTNFTIADPSPYPGTQVYRVKLTTNAQTSIYSSTVEILYVRENDVYVYPNPIIEGESLQIIINNEEVAALEIFDVQGRPVRKSEDFGPIKEVNTIALPRGIYIVKIIRNDGKVWNRRISVL
jgi:hypothetical protein